MAVFITRAIQMEALYSVVFNNNGEPNFTSYSFGEVSIKIDTKSRRHNHSEDANIRIKDYKAATETLWARIKSGDIDSSIYTPDQLSAIELNTKIDSWIKIPDLTWHHNGNTLNSDGTGNMMLVKTDVHHLFTHKGWHSYLKNGDI